PRWRHQEMHAEIPGLHAVVFTHRLPGWMVALDKEGRASLVQAEISLASAAAAQLLEILAHLLGRKLLHPPVMRMRVREPAMNDGQVFGQLQRTQFQAANGGHVLLEAGLQLDHDIDSKGWTRRGNQTGAREAV